MPGPRKTIAAVASALAIVLSLTAQSAAARVFQPTRFNDPTPGKCSPHDCSLREAVIAANAHAGADKIKLAKGHYKLSLPDTGNDDASDGDLDVTDEATIVGAGSSKTIVDGQQISAVFSFLTFSTHALKGVTVENGLAPAGAGISVGPSKFTGKDLVVKKNTATNDGGGITTDGRLHLVHTTIAHNHASRGGGIFAAASFGQTPVLNLSYSTVAHNTAATAAGIYNDGTNEYGNNVPGKLNLLNDTVAANHASADGGGVTTTDSAQTTIRSSTIAGNIVDNNGAGGLTNTNASVAMGDSVVGRNSFTLVLPLECEGALTAGTRNVIESFQSCGLDPNKNRAVESAGLGKLGSYGGPTQTVPLKKQSPAIKYARHCPRRDQRGVKRPHRCDAGAFERTPA